MTFHGFILTFPLIYDFYRHHFRGVLSSAFPPEKLYLLRTEAYGSLFIFCILVDGRSRALLFSPPSLAPVVKFWAIRPQLTFWASKPR
jgi:hypothetical protein